MAWDDRFQEAPDYDGPECDACGAYIHDDNPRAEFKVWQKDPNVLDGHRWFKPSAHWGYRVIDDGCRECYRDAAKANAIAFLEDGNDGLEDALDALAEYLGIATGACPKAHAA